MVLSWDDNRARLDGTIMTRDSVTGVKYSIEPNQIADIQNNTHQLPHPWDYYTGTSQTDYELSLIHI